MEKLNFEIASPNPAALIESLRSFGYSLNTAVADIIDNSITAKSQNINIIFEWNNNNPYIAIVDDGLGMDANQLYEAMKTGSQSPLLTRNEADLGRFGLGLKTASFSQCRKLTVASKKPKTNLEYRSWDLDLVAERNEWILLKEVNEETRKSIELHFDNRCSGTIVFWENLDRLIPFDMTEDEKYQEAFQEAAVKVKNHVSQVFSDFMKGINKIKFYMNGRIINNWDPFMLDYGTTTQPSETLVFNGNEIIIQPFILPHYSKLTPEQINYGAGNSNWFENQGFYIYRNNRLIISGSWLIDGLEKKEQYKLARIRIDIGNTQDEEWSIDVKKSKAHPPVPIQENLRVIATIARRRSSAVYNHRGKKIARNSKVEKSFVWHQIQRRDKIGFSINRKHPLIQSLIDSPNGKDINNLLRLLEETIPVPMIISSYTEENNILRPYEGLSLNEVEKDFNHIYKSLEIAGLSNVEIISIIANTEPFVHFSEKISLWAESKGVK